MDIDRRLRRGHRGTKFEDRNCIADGQIVKADVYIYMVRYVDCSKVQESFILYIMEIRMVMVHIMLEMLFG